MPTQQPLENPGQGIQKNKPSGSNGSDPWIRLLSEILHTREVRTTLACAVPEILNIWAGNHFAKNIASRAIGKNIQSGFSRPQDISGRSELPKVFQKPDRIQDLADQMPRMLDSFFDLAAAVGSGIEKLPVKERRQAVETLLSGLFSGRTGSLITVWARVLSSVQSDSPDFLIKTLEPGVKKWIQDTDFGEVKEGLDSVSSITGDVVKMINDVIWKYPAKVVLLVSFLPTIGNMILKTVNECLSRFNNLAPDLVADVILSCFRDLDPHNLGQTVNELAELVRKLDTGSPLIGDSGVSGFERDIAVFLDQLSSSIEVEKLHRAAEGIAAGKETISSQIFERLKEHPEITLESIRRMANRHNPGIKTLSRKADLICDLPEQKTADAFSKGLSKLEFNEMAEIGNLTALLVNRIRSHQPDLFASMVTQIVDSIDLYEVEDAVQGLFQDIRENIKPLGRIFLPHLITLACECLSPDENHDEPAFEEARDAVRRLLQPKEVAS